MITTQSMTTQALVREYGSLKVLDAQRPWGLTTADHDRLSSVVAELRSRGVLD